MVRKCVEVKSGAVYAAKIMRKRRVARGVAAADIGILKVSSIFKKSPEKLLLFIINSI